MERLYKPKGVIDTANEFVGAHEVEYLSQLEAQLTHTKRAAASCGCRTCLLADRRARTQYQNELQRVYDLNADDPEPIILLLPAKATSLDS